MTTYALCLLFGGGVPREVKAALSLIILVLIPVGFGYGLNAWIHLHRAHGRGLWKAIFGTCLSAPLLLMLVYVMLKHP